MKTFLFILNLILFLFAILPIIPFWISFLSFLISLQISLNISDFSYGKIIQLINYSQFLIPIILLFRTRMKIKALFLLFLQNFPLKLLVLFIGYMSIASFWSPFPTEALEQIAFVLLYGIIAILFYKVMSENPEKFQRLIEAWVIISMMISVINQLFIGYPYVLLETRRLSTFTAHQGYALYLLFSFIFLSFFYFKAKNFQPQKIIILIAIFASVLVNGSRTALLSVLLFMAGGFLYHWLTLRTFKRYSWIVPITIIGIILVGSVAFIGSELRGFDVFEIFFDPTQVTEIGTANFRLRMYEVVISRIKSFSTKEIILGNGTSSGGIVVTEGDINYRGYDETTVDPNRIIHNVYLRVFFEWGLIGSILFFGMLLMIFIFTFNLVMKNILSSSNFLLLMGFLIILMVMGVSNILAASKTASGASILLILVSIWISIDKLRSKLAGT